MGCRWLFTASLSGPLGKVGLGCLVQGLGPRDQDLMLILSAHSDKKPPAHLLNGTNQDRRTHHLQSQEYEIWVWLRIKQEGLRRVWSMFPLARVPLWHRFFQPQLYGSLKQGDQAAQE